LARTVRPIAALAKIIDRLRASNQYYPIQAVYYRLQAEQADREMPPGEFSIRESLFPSGPVWYE
jgi:hypothetical protein